MRGYDSNLGNAVLMVVDDLDMGRTLLQKSSGLFDPFLGRWCAQESRRFHLLVQRDAVEIEAVRPSQDSIVQKHPGEESDVAQRFDHLAAFGDQIGEVALTLAAVRECQGESITSARLDPYHVDQLEHPLLRIHSTSAPGMRCNGRRARARISARVPISSKTNPICSGSKSFSRGHHVGQTNP